MDLCISNFDRGGTIVKLFVDFFLPQDGHVDALEHDEPDNMHGQQRGQKDDVQVDEGIELSSVFGVAVLSNAPDYYRQADEAHPEPNELHANERNRSVVSEDRHVHGLGDVNEDVASVVQDDNHGADGQEVAEEEAEEEEARDGVVKEHLLVVAASLSREYVVD